jgi:hypothetical protein
MARASPPEQNRRTNFFSLSAEIRFYIYELVLDDEISIPPPIIQVSRRIREESLEYWHGPARFSIHFRITSWYYGIKAKRGTPNYDIVSTAPEFAYPTLLKLLLRVKAMQIIAALLTLTSGPTLTSLNMVITVFMAGM